MTPTRGRVRAAAAAAAALAAVVTAGCGITPTGPTPAGAPASGIPQPVTQARSVQLYFAGPYGLRAVNRPTGRPLSPQQALDLLLEGPTAAEGERGLITQVPPMAGQLTATTADGAVDLYVPRTVSSGDRPRRDRRRPTGLHRRPRPRPRQPPRPKVDIRIRENLPTSTAPWTVRCNPRPRKSS